MRRDIIWHELCIELHHLSSQNFLATCISYSNFQSSESDENVDEDSEDATSGLDRRHRRNLRAAEKQINRRKWERRREEILVEYESFSYYSTASSVVLFDLAWKQSLDNLTLLW